MEEKTDSGIVLLVLAIVVVSLAGAIVFVKVTPGVRDDWSWRWACRKDTADAYQSYLASWRQGRHAEEATERYDERAWAQAVDANATGCFEQYLQVHPYGKHIFEAEKKIESLRWKEALSAHSVRALQAFLTQYPGSRFAADARARQAVLRADNEPYLRARNAGTEQALLSFLEEYPGHRHEAEAHAAIKDLRGRDIVDLLEERKIEAQTRGSGIQAVNVRVRRLVPYPVAVRIPVGTYFVSQDSSSQNMVTTAETTLTLHSDDWTSVSPAAACANRPRDIPGDTDRFAVQRSPNQEELARLMPILERAGATYAVRQAAVWIVTDDANYKDLGSLVRRSQWSSPFGGTRLICEREAAEALRICETAGVEVRRKAIWQDREVILRGLEDGDLKNWLVNKP